ncbi:MAG TPA: glycerate kinase, partial [Phycisphaerae bacterium]|nr:glycerate kinase [Phycisphaerae bacterium]
MRIVIASNSFKGTLTAPQACAAMAAGVRAACPDAEVIEAPLADGGEGTVVAIVQATGGELRTACVTGPLGDPVEAAFGLLDGGRRAVVEMAAASGILL